MSAVILARLITKVENAFCPLIEISSLSCYLDSMTALYWCNRNKKEDSNPRFQSKIGTTFQLLITLRTFQPDHPDLVISRRMTYGFMGLIGFI